jgi:DNA mismatch repair protein MSH6
MRSTFGRGAGARRNARKDIAQGQEGYRVSDPGLLEFTLADTTSCPTAKFWHSAQGGKDIYNIEVPVKTKVPQNWAKQSSTGVSPTSRRCKRFMPTLTIQKIARYLTPETMPRIRALQEARERSHTAKRAFFTTLMQEFDKDRSEWLKAIRVIAELDCLVSLAKASAGLDSPKCRPTFVDTKEAFVDFTELRHPSMCLRSSFIANDVQLGGDSPRQVLLTGPNMAGKSTLLRMTAAGVIMAQLGCYVPAESARLSPIDRIQTRMGAYDSGSLSFQRRVEADM